MINIFNIADYLCKIIPENGHYFCVVQTVEASRPVVTVVPHQWVDGEFLLWPPKKADRLRKNAACKPESNWNKIPCVVKRKYIPTMVEAEAEAAYLSGITTDTSDSPAPSKKKIKMTVPTIQELDLNHLIENDGL